MFLETELNTLEPVTVHEIHFWNIYYHFYILHFPPIPLISQTDATISRCVAVLVSCNKNEEETCGTLTNLLRHKL